MRTHLLLRASLLFLALTLPAAAGDYYVNGTSGNNANNGTSPGNAWKSIGHAIASVPAGLQTIHVAPGTYSENLDFQGKPIHLVSSHGPAVTIIDGASAGSVISMVSGEGSDSVVEGFTIRNGTGTLIPIHFAYFGGGIYCQSTSPTIMGNVFIGNTADAGGALFCGWANVPVTIQDNEFLGNSADTGGAIFCAFTLARDVIVGNVFTGNMAEDGAALYTAYANPLVENDVFRYNQASEVGGAIYIDDTSLPILRNDVLHDNQAGDIGGAIAVEDSDLFIDGCTFARNSAVFAGGAIHTLQRSFVDVKNSILWGNAAPVGSEVALFDQSVMNLAYSTMSPGGDYLSSSTLNKGLGCLSADPLFIAPAQESFHLSQVPPQPAGSPVSPGVDGGDPASPLAVGSTRTDGVADAGIVDMGWHYGVLSVGGFCTAKSGLACGIPAIAAIGAASASAASGYVVSAGPARSCKLGILLYNTAATTGLAFQGGTLCIATGGLRRAGPTSSGGTPGNNCDGRFTIDMNTFARGLWTVPDCAGNPSGTPPNNPALFLSNAGTLVFAQFWGRDSVATGSFVSDATRWYVGP